MKPITSLIGTSINSKAIECALHGSYTSNLYKKPDGTEIWSDCPKCIQEAIERERLENEAAINNYRAQKKKELEQQKEKAQRTPLDEFTGVNYTPKRDTFSLKSWDDIKLSENEKVAEYQNKVYTSLERYANDFAARIECGRNLIFHSETVGSGKTQIALLIGRTIRKHGFEYAFLPLEKLIRNISSCKENGFSEYDIITRLESIDLLIIDDVKGGNLTDKQQEFYQEKLFSVLNGRNLEGLPTIITTNLNPEALKESVGVRVYDRLVQEVRFINFFWSSYRSHKV